MAGFDSNVGKRPNPRFEKDASRAGFTSLACAPQANVKWQRSHVPQ